MMRISVLTGINAVMLVFVLYEEIVKGVRPFPFSPWLEIVGGTILLAAPWILIRGARAPRRKSTTGSSYTELPPAVALGLGYVCAILYAATLAGLFLELMKLPYIALSR